MSVVGPPARVRCGRTAELRRVAQSSKNGFSDGLIIQGKGSGWRDICHRAARHTRRESRNMPRATQYVPHGVIPAVLLPFAEDFSIDENSFRKHLRDVTETPDLSAITINAHSTEVAS